MLPAAFVDIDGTLYEGFTTPDFLAVLHERDALDPEVFRSFVFLLEEDTRRQNDYESWAIDVTQSISKIFVGTKADEYVDHLAAFVDAVGPRLYPFARPLIERLGETGYDVVLVTGAHEFVAQVTAVELGLRDCSPNESC